MEIAPKLLRGAQDTENSLSTESLRSNLPETNTRREVRRDFANQQTRRCNEDQNPFVAEISC